jgi:uncharacterized C2H2 Zn-finger protein
MVMRCRGCLDFGCSVCDRDAYMLYSCTICHSVVKQKGMIRHNNSIHAYNMGL